MYFLQCIAVFKFCGDAAVVPLNFLLSNMLWNFPTIQMIPERSPQLPLGFQDMGRKAAFLLFSFFESQQQQMAVSVVQSFASMYEALDLIPSIMKSPNSNKNLIK